MYISNDHAAKSAADTYIEDIVAAAVVLVVLIQILKTVLLPVDKHFRTNQNIYIQYSGTLIQYTFPGIR